MSWISAKTQNKYFISFITFTLAALIEWFSFRARSVGGTLVSIFLAFISLMLTIGATNLLLLLCSVTFSLAVAEFSLEILFHKDPLTASPESDYANPNYWSKSDLGSQPSHGRHTSKELTSGGEVVYDVVYSIGEDGFRITALNNSNARIHINFFGCSLMFGEGLNDDETLPYFLHAIDNSISVKNFASHGYGVHQALRILESTRDTKGDINFLLTSPWHAERSACIPDYSKGSPRYKLADDGRLTLDGTCEILPNQEGFISRALNRSNMYQLAKYALRESQDRQMELYLAIIGQINKLSQARNQRFIVGFVKAKNPYFNGRYSNEKIVEELIEMGIEVIDVTLARSAEELSREYYIHPLDKHPSARANEARAKLLYQYLEKRSVLYLDTPSFRVT